MAYDWKNRSVLVTGATGILGSWLVDELVKKGANVTVIVRDDVPTSNFHMLGLERKVNVVRGELENYFLVERALNEYEAEHLMHLGAQTIVGTANRSPLATFEANIKGTWNVLEAARNSRTVKSVVCASSDKAYGEGRQLPYTEDMPLMGDYPYDVSKSCADLIARSYFKTYGLPVSITRCGNIYGGGDLNWSRIVPGTIRCVLRNERPVIRGNGKMVRDYFYALDAVDGYLALAERMNEKKFHGEAFNFSSGNHLQTTEIVGRILKLMRANLKPLINNEAKGEILNQSLSSAKAEKWLGWKARWGLDSGLKETVAWYRKYFKK